MRTVENVMEPVGYSNIKCSRKTIYDKYSSLKYRKCEKKTCPLNELTRDKMAQFLAKLSQWSEDGFVNTRIIDEIVRDNFRLSKVYKVVFSEKKPNKTLTLKLRANQKVEKLTIDITKLKTFIDQVVEILEKTQKIQEANQIRLELKGSTNQDPAIFSEQPIKTHSGEYAFKKSFRKYPQKDINYKTDFIINDKIQCIMTQKLMSRRVSYQNELVDFLTIRKFNSAISEILSPLFDTLESKCLEQKINLKVQTVHNKSIYFFSELKSKILLNKHLESKFTRYHIFHGIDFDWDYSPTDEISLRQLYEPNNNECTKNSDSRFILLQSNQLNSETQTISEVQSKVQISDQNSETQTISEIQSKVQIPDQNSGTQTNSDIQLKVKISVKNTETQTVLNTANTSCQTDFIAQNANSEVFITLIVAILFLQLINLLV
jgi:hypothetical protein